jgi:hypothetical protein
VGDLKITFGIMFGKFFILKATSFLEGASRITPEINVDLIINIKIYGVCVYMYLCTCFLGIWSVL